MFYTIYYDAFALVFSHVHSYFLSLFIFHVPSLLSPSPFVIHFFSFLFCLPFLSIYIVLLRIKNARSRTFIHLLIIIFHVSFARCLALIDLPRSLFLSSLPALQCGSVSAGVGVYVGRTIVLPLFRSALQKMLLFFFFFLFWSSQ